MKYLFEYFVALLLFISGCSIQEASKDNFNIVLITIDALRADHLSCYGYERNTSPNIDKIAEKGIVFNNVIAPSSWTAPSMVSLFTSVYPINHGIIKGLARGGKIHKQNVFSDDLITLAELLNSNGYDTFGVASNLHLSEKFGFARGFDYFKCLPWAPAERVNRTIASWQDQIENADKFFLWVHYFDPHHFYQARSPWIEHYTSQELTQQLNLSNKSADYLQRVIPTLKKEALSNLVALYDSEINYVDSYIAELIKKFELDENTLIIITADHGEEFFEHGRLGHGYNLHKETIKIPLIIKLPQGAEKEIVEEYVNLVDIMPTVIDILKINPSEQMFGKSAFKKRGRLFRFINMLVNGGMDECVFTELDRMTVLKAILTPEWKYVYNYKNKTDQLYNIKLDPNEINNLAENKAKKCNQLKEQLLKWVATSKTYPVKSASFQLSQEEKEKLEAMGYLATQENEDDDKDGVSNNQDHCLNIPNQDQEDTDGNGIGNKCEPSVLEYRWLEAENADTIIEPLEVANDDNASEGRFIYSPNDKRNQYVPSPIMATYKINISQAGDYILLGRVKAIDKRDNSFFVQIDDDSDIFLWEIEAGNYWHWDAVNDLDGADPVNFSLTEGVHTIKVKLREDGTKLDKMLLTNDVHFVPSGKGGITEKQVYLEGN